MGSDTARGRPVTLLDAMVLIAATGLGLAATRAYLTSLRAIPGIATPLRHWLSATSPCLAAWALALLVLRLRQPRPAYRQLGGHPGGLACLMTAIGLPIGGGAR